MANKIKPTSKQKKFVEGKLAGKSSRQAALDAGYGIHAANNADRDITEHRGTKAYINKLGAILDDIGVTDEFLATRVQEGLSAVKTDITGDKHDDFRTRLDYIKYAGDLKGHKVNNELELKVATINLIVKQNGSNKPGDQPATETGGSITDVI